MLISFYVGYGSGLIVGFWGCSYFFFNLVRVDSNLGEGCYGVGCGLF